MIAAIMQPYFFPYIGYFQLMRAVDVFVVYDDVQYMKGGWVNRNRILAHGAPSWFTLPVLREGLSLRINERHYVRDPWIAKLRQQLDASYSKAPGYPARLPLLQGLLEYGDINVGRYNTHLIAGLARELRIDCRIVVSSEIDKPDGLKGQERVIDLCGRIGARTYVNPPGGMGLYEAAAFEQAGIALRFVQPNPVRYEQFGAPFVPNLSIIDMLMFNSGERVGAMLDDFRVVAGDGAPAR